MPANDAPATSTPPPPGPKTTFALIAAPTALVVALVAALGQNDAAHEGRRYTPYRDGAGYWTVCAGVTGAAVVPGRTYTPAECTRLETTYVTTMLSHMGQCVRGEFTFDQAKAWGHFAYNIGTPAFCRSTAARRLNAGERGPACAEMLRYRFVTIDGAKRDCSLPQWRSKCGGIIARRAWEYTTCAGAPPPDWFAPSTQRAKDQAPTAPGGA